MSELEPTSAQADQSGLTERDVATARELHDGIDSSTPSAASHATATAVRFTFPDLGANTVALLGEFSDWQPLPMERIGDGFAASVRLEAGRSYRFKFLIDDERWENAHNADDYVRNEFGGTDAVVFVKSDAQAADH